MQLSIKRLFEKLVMYHTLHQSVPTKTNSNVWKSGDILCLRRGDVVTIKFNGVAFGAVSARTEFALIPEGWRPLTETGMPMDASTTWIFCRPNGTIAINPTAAATHWGTVTYIAAMP